MERGKEDKAKNFKQNAKKTHQTHLKERQVMNGGTGRKESVPNIYIS